MTVDDDLDPRVSDEGLDGILEKLSTVTEHIPVTPSDLRSIVAELKHLRVLRAEDLRVVSPAMHWMRATMLARKAPRGLGGAWARRAVVDAAKHLEGECAKVAWERMRRSFVDLDLEEVLSAPAPHDEATS